MSTKDKPFETEVLTGYQFTGPSVALGCAALEGKPVPKSPIGIPLSAFTKHGLVAGATGTGKTKTVQHLAEELSKSGVPVLLMDVKGDLSGISQPGEPSEKVLERAKLVGSAWQPKGFPVEFLTLSPDQPGARLRATVSEFGPVLFSRLLELNETQAGAVAVVFKYSDDNQLPLVDLGDFRKVLNYLTNEGKKEIEEMYGAIATTSASTILRKIVEIEGQGAGSFFGEPSFDVYDLLGQDSSGNARISVVRLESIQDRPKLFSTFMLQLLAEVYAKFPEMGDVAKPKLVIFFDEAHLLFEEASKSLLDQIEMVCKLIRSKGIGLFFVTQNPTDVPSGVLAQLGTKVQHALRAHTAADRQAIKLVAQNYPESSYYEVEQLITELGVGEALVTTLSDRGIPTPLVQVVMAPPSSRMDVVTDAELQAATTNSQLTARYSRDMDPESAKEMLSKRISDAAASAPVEAPKAPSSSRQTVTETVLKQAARTAASSITNTVIRTVLGSIFGSSRRSY